jgi:hypothetical protein
VDVRAVVKTSTIPLNAASFVFATIITRTICSKGFHVNQLTSCLSSFLDLALFGMNSLISVLNGLSVE